MEQLSSSLEKISFTRKRPFSEIFESNEIYFNKIQQDNSTDSKKTIITPESIYELMEDYLNKKKWWSKDEVKNIIYQLINLLKQDDDKTKNDIVKSGNDCSYIS